MPIISDKDKHQLIAEAMDPSKVTLTCGTHHFAYGGTLPPNFKCKKCMFTLFFGLIANTPPDKRQDQMDMLEETVHKLIEAKDEAQYQDFFRRPEVYVNDKQIGVPKVN